jgi:hypothetical protein
MVGRLWVNGVSFNQLTAAPAALRAHSLGPVLATPLAEDADRRPAVTSRRHLVTLGRITLSRASMWRRPSPTTSASTWSWPVRSGLATPQRRLPPHTPMTNPDLQFWRDHVAPLVDGRRVRWIGVAVGADRDALAATARASLIPIGWEEPGGTAVVESLAPRHAVVGFARGACPNSSSTAGRACSLHPGMPPRLGWPSPRSVT